ncbi:MAG TPA: Fe-S cluster assembly protein SufD [Candidatus Thermoplasmatota archaeon]|nr:Fe-S cluster assembly protein SufD [Candidatus Thermoplasmatota archaeon]
MAQAVAKTIHPVQQAYLDAFKAGGWDKRGPGFVREARESAMAAFAETGFPSPKAEAWKHTPLRELTATAFQPVERPSRPVTESEVAPYRLAGAIELVFVDGHHVPMLDGLTDELVQPLSRAVAKPTEDLEAQLARHAGDEPFTALNTAFWQDGGYVRLPAEEVVAEPIHLLHVSTEPASPTASHVRHLILAGPQSQATVVESYVGLPSGSPALTTAVTELVAGPGAHVRRAKLQRENLHAFHVGHLAVRQDRTSVVHDNLLSIGGQLARNEVDGVLGMEGSELHLNGLFLATGSQHVDCPTLIDHAVPHTTSRELYKGVLDGRSHGVFLGSVKVRADAQKTDSMQTNRNLILSTGALMDTTPQLEIHADDVKCAHGSTIGQLSKDALFFLRSRGIGEEDARLVLTKGFAHEVLERFPEPIRPLADGLLEQWFACRKTWGVA